MGKDIVDNPILKVGIVGSRKYENRQKIKQFIREKQKTVVDKFMKHIRGVY